MEHLMVLNDSMSSYIQNLSKKYAVVVEKLNQISDTVVMQDHIIRTMAKNMSKGDPSKRMFVDFT
jgi:hypothetical protein